MLYCRCRLSLAASVHWVRDDQAVSLLADGGELFSVSWRCSVDLRTSESLGLTIISSLLQLTGEPISGERSPGFSGVACRAVAVVASGRFIMYNMLPMRLDTCGGGVDPY